VCKVGFIALLFPLLFLGCGVSSYSIRLWNNTETKIVSYTYNGTENTLAPGYDRFYQVGAWTQPPANVVDQHGIASLKVVTNGMTGDHTFVHARQIRLEVMNTLPIGITIQADNFIYNNIDSDDDESRTTMFLAIDARGMATAAIYTDSPRFTAPTDICEDKLAEYGLHPNTSAFPFYFDFAITTFYDDEEEPPEVSEPPYDNGDDNGNNDDNNGELPQRQPRMKMSLTIR